MKKPAANIVLRNLMKELKVKAEMLTKGIKHRVAVLSKPVSGH